MAKAPTNAAAQRRPFVHIHGNTATAGANADCLVNRATTNNDAARTASIGRSVRRAVYNPPNRNAMNTMSTRAMSNHAPPTRYEARKTPTATAGPMNPCGASRRTSAHSAAHVASEATTDTDRKAVRFKPPTRAVIDPSQ